MNINFDINKVALQELVKIQIIAWEFLNEKLVLRFVIL